MHNAGRGNRTPTLFLERDFKSRASANSAIPANLINGGDDGIRTHDNGFADHGLNQLGYVT